jgi:hypothetical protein
MPARKPPPPDEKPQFERFIETARQIGAGETDEALDRVVRKIAPERRRGDVMPSAPHPHRSGKRASS